MNVRELANHPGVYMREDATIQFDLFEANHGIIGVNRAMVSEASQQALIDRWNKGGVFNRPPYLYEPKRPARASDHVQGDAFDTSDITHTLKHIEPYGFYRNYEWDKPHFKFDPARVRVRPIKVEDFKNMEELVSINGKVYGVGFGQIKHVRNPVQLADVKNITKLPLVELTDHRRVDAWANLLDFYAIDPSAINNAGLILDPFSGTYDQGNAWSEERAIRAEFRASLRVKK